MHQGQTTGLLCQGFNPLMSIAYKGKTVAALAKLKFLVSMDPIETDTVRFWENHGEFNDVDTAGDPDRGLHAAGDLLRRGGRHADQLEPGRPVEVEGGRPVRRVAHRHRRSWPTSSCASAQLYEEEGGTAPEPLLAVDWSYADPAQPTADELLKELNGKALADLKDAEGKVTRKAGEQLAELRRDARRRLDRRRASGSTPASTGRRATSPSGATTPTRAGLGVYGNWGFAWPANRRILYNRASADPQGKPVERGEGLRLLGRRRSGPGRTCRTSSRPTRRANGSGPFIMNPEGVSRLWARGHDGGRPVPGALRAVRGAGGQPDVPEGPGQPGGAGVRQRLRDLRRRRASSRSSPPPTG